MKPKKVRPVKVSAAVQGRYRKRLMAANKQYKKIVDRRVKILLRDMKEVNKLDPVAQVRFANKIEKRIVGLRRNLEAANRKSTRAVDIFIEEMKREHARRTRSSFKKHANVDAILAKQASAIDKVAQTMRAEYVKSITSANKDYSDRVTLALLQQLTDPKKAKRKDNARAQITAAKGIVTRRIKNTVQNHAHELNSKLNQKVQPAMGATHYLWKTKEDERVRPTHVDRGQAPNNIYSYKERPPITGHPGEDINCRCIAIPVIGYEGPKSPRTGRVSTGETRPRRTNRRGGQSRPRQRARNDVRRSSRRG